MAGNRSRESGLTVEAQRFAELVFHGESPTMTQAYVDAGYSTKQSRKAIQNSASKLWRSARVIAYVAKLQIRRDAQRSRREAGLAQRVLHGLWLEATPTTDYVGEGHTKERGRGESSASRVQALTRIGQSISLFTEKRVVEQTTTSSAELIAEIIGAVEAMAEHASVNQHAAVSELAAELDPARAEPGPASEGELSPSQAVNSGAEVDAEWSELAKGHPPAE